MNGMDFQKIYDDAKASRFVWIDKCDEPKNIERILDDLKKNIQKLVEKNASNGNFCLYYKSISKCGELNQLGSSYGYSQLNLVEAEHIRTKLATALIKYGLSVCVFPKTSIETLNTVCIQPNIQQKG